MELKICGLTRTEDIAAAVAASADWFGLILYQPSPRSVSWPRAVELLQHIPCGRAVCVDVDPDPEVLAERLSGGFGAFQIHCPVETPLSRVRKWSEAVGRDRLWLAPRIPPGSEFPVEVLEWADTVLLDSYDPGLYGGSGKTGNWRHFSELRQYYGAVRWILAGGLGPTNVAEAIAASGARFIDVNSGVESAPGIKDHAKLRELRTRLSSITG